jgi:hypothetical protein
MDCLDTYGGSRIAPSILLAVPVRSKTGRRAKGRRASALGHDSKRNARSDFMRPRTVNWRGNAPAKARLVQCPSDEVSQGETRAWRRWRSSACGCEVANCLYIQETRGLRAFASLRSRIQGRWERPPGVSAHGGYHADPHAEKRQLRPGQNRRTEFCFVRGSVEEGREDVLQQTVRQGTS